MEIELGDISLCVNFLTGVSLIFLQKSLLSGLEGNQPQTINLSWPPASLLTSSDLSDIGGAILLCCALFLLFFFFSRPFIVFFGSYNNKLYCSVYWYDLIDMNMIDILLFIYINHTFNLIRWDKFFCFRCMRHFYFYFFKEKKYNKTVHLWSCIFRAMHHLKIFPQMLTTVYGMTKCM